MGGTFFQEYRLTLLIFLSSFAKLSIGQDAWCYAGDCGPKNWGGSCKTGKIPSPIDFEVDKITKVPPGQTLAFSREYYETHTNMVIRNTGTTIAISEDPDVMSPSKGKIRTNGSIWKDIFRFREMRFHWKAEHLVKGRRYPLELQIIHERMSGRNLTAIISILFALSKNDSKVLAPIIAALPEIRDAGKSLRLTSGLKISSLLPNMWDVFRYNGSLTNPPCTEIVLWSVFAQRMPISQAQLNQFLQIKDNAGNSITRNYRPVQKVETVTRENIFWAPIKKSTMVTIVF